MQDTSFVSATHIPSLIGAGETVTLDARKRDREDSKDWIKAVPHKTDVRTFCGTLEGVIVDNIQHHVEV